jgi:dienelactone hydrolase
MKKISLTDLVKIIMPVIFTFFFSGPGYSQPEKENLNVFDRWIEWSDGKNMFIHDLNKQAFKYLDERDKEIGRLVTKEDWINRQNKVKEILMKTVGPLPEKTPLNAKVTGIVKKDGFRIEKVVYESMPNLYVTACMFIPDGIKGKTRKPAIIQVSGHGFPAYRSPGTQKQLYNLVKKGFIVFAIDPLGQGERIQYWDDAKKASMMGTSPTSEHSYFGDQMFISGISPIRYFTWDGIRGVDYLLTRKEVDPERIGIFGCSGGGTQTTFISALDDRIRAAVPGCYITGFRRLLESIGPQDAEQNIYHGIMHGITHADMLELRAPKPLLISSTTRDFFSIQGAVETFSEVKKAYRAFGQEENAGQVFDDAGHGFNKNITAIYAFFQKVFNVPGSPDEMDFEGFKPEELQVTTTGQVATSLGGETGFSINEKESQKLIKGITESRNNTVRHLSDVQSKAKELSGYISPDLKIRSVFRGRYQRNGYAVEMYALQSGGDYVIPLLLFVPKNGKEFPAVIYVHPKGKLADAMPGGKVEQLVMKGYIVAVPDVIGTGEVGSGDINGPYYVSVMIGRSVTGIQAGDISTVVNYLKTRDDVNTGLITGMAFDNMCPALLHAAAFDRSIRSVALTGSLLSYKSIVQNRFYERSFADYAVPGMLTAYDLPDLMGCIAPGKVALVESKDHMNKPASRTLINEELLFPQSAFRSKNVPGNLSIIPDQGDIVKIAEWCMQ